MKPHICTFLVRLSFIHLESYNSALLVRAVRTTMQTYYSRHSTENKIKVQRAHEQKMSMGFPADFPNERGNKNGYFFLKASLRHDQVAALNAFLSCLKFQQQSLRFSYTSVVSFRKQQHNNNQRMWNCSPNHLKLPFTREWLIENVILQSNHVKSCSFSLRQYPHQST